MGFGKPIEAAKPALTELLQEEGYGWRLRIPAAITLQRLGGDPRLTVPILSDAIKRGGPHLKEATAALLEIGQEAVPALLELLKDKGAKVFVRAYNLVPHLDTRALTAALINSLRDPQRQLRREAASFLSFLRREEALTPLIEALGDKDWEMRYRVVEALGRLGSQRAVPALTQALEDKDTDVRRRAAVALESLGVSGKVMISSY